MLVPGLKGLSGLSEVTNQTDQFKNEWPFFKSSPNIYTNSLKIVDAVNNL